MNSKASSRTPKQSQPSHPLPLQTLNENQQDRFLSHRSCKDKPSQKTSKQLPQQSSQFKAKVSKQLRSKENTLESKKTSVSSNSKTADEKEEAFAIPMQNSKLNEAKENTEKHVEDLNKSLANLALRRCIGRSSSDNDAIGHLNKTETDLHQRSYGPSSRHLETQPANSSPLAAAKTPFVNKKPIRGFQTSVQKGFDMTPFALSMQEHRENGRFQSTQNRRDTYHKDLTLSDLDYGKFQSGAYGKSARPTQNMQHYLPLDTRTRPQGRHFVTEGSYRMEFSNLDNFDNTETQTFSQYFSNDAGLSYLHGEYCQDIGTENLREIDSENQIDSVRQLDVRQKHEPKYKGHQRKPSGSAHFGPHQGSGCPPAFKGCMKGRNNVEVASDSNIRRYSDLTSTFGAKLEIRSQKESSEKLELNSISDGVRYIKGGVGTNSSDMRKKQKQNTRNRSNLTVPETNGRSSKFEGFESVRKETLENWKQDIMNIKKDMETRKKSYAEVNKFVKMYENGNNPVIVKGSREGSLDLNLSQKKSNIPPSNLNKVDKFEAIKQYYNPVGYKVQVAQDNKRKIDKKKKTSFDMKTLEDYGSNRFGTGFGEEQISASSKMRIKTAPYYDFSNDTNEVNSSFVYEDNIVLDRTQKTPCCGPGKLCNIF